jgi:uncharacterized protein (DUF302 family)
LYDGFRFLKGGVGMNRSLIGILGPLSAIVIGLALSPASRADESSPEVTSTSTTHLNYKTSKSFDAVTAAIEKQLGKFDAAALASVMSSSMSAADIESKVHAMEGSSGLMLFAIRDHGQLLSLKGRKASAKQYELGNPLIASQMTQVDLRAGEYAPLRILVYVGTDTMTHVDYDLPSTVFGRFKSEAVGKVASGLDHKLEVLVANAMKD